MKNLVRDLVLFLTGILTGYYTKVKKNKLESYKLMFNKYKEKHELQKKINGSRIDNILNKL